MWWSASTVLFARRIPLPPSVVGSATGVVVSTAAETAEKLEQLRVLEHGYTILAAEVAYDGAGIDTPEDYAAFVRRVREAR